ncbi:MAG: metalloregulator ArsR/SmtB family transcription factor [Dehalococcoidia bacterium]|nr:metalloregulator ArsR/SmtB family transcription factor [Dehalococcoidia bacterium]MDZ4246934.1 metalloregulator ArsR/SmtB family transcription factor [Dehalococcoidia bacterium]
MAGDRCKTREIHPEKVDAARGEMLDDRKYADLAEIFSALADSNRAKIIYSLVHHELCVCDLACVVGISESAVSQHLRILRTLRLVKQRKDGRMAFYSLNDDHIRVLLDVCLEHIRHR